jgi:hypothetical protein
MLIKFTTSGLKRTRWYEFVIRFTLAGLVTAGAGFVSKVYGPSLGGLFLAFPAILAASTTLVARHEQRRKRAHRQNGLIRGRQAAGADAAGATLGSLGLIAFAIVACELLPHHNAAAVIAGAMAIWATLCAVTWWCWKQHPLRRFRRILMQ